MPVCLNRLRLMMHTEYTNAWCGPVHVSFLNRPQALQNHFIFQSKASAKPFTGTYMRCDAQYALNPYLIGFNTCYSRHRLHHACWGYWIETAKKTKRNQPFACWIGIMSGALTRYHANASPDLYNNSRM